MLNLNKVLCEIEVRIDSYPIDSFFCEEGKDPDTQIEEIVEDYENFWDERIESNRVSLVFTFWRDPETLDTESCTLNQWYDGYFWKC